jgi:hypothetical protein
MIENWRRMTSCGLSSAALVLAMGFAEPCSAIEKADFWLWDTHPWGGTQWWSQRPPQVPPQSPSDPHLVQNFGGIAVNPNMGGGGGLNFEIDNAAEPTTHFDLSGVLGNFDDSETYDNGVTRLETFLTAARVTLLEPVAEEINATSDMGVVTGDMAGHSLLVDQGTYSYVEYDAANIVIASGSVDFSATPMELGITSGSAVFSSSLQGGLSLDLATGMGPSYFGNEQVMLMFTLELDAVAVPEPTGLFLGFVSMAISTMLARDRRDRRKFRQ